MAMQEMRDSGEAEFSTIVSAAGGWAGGGIGTEPRDLIQSVEDMWRMNIQSAVTASMLAGNFLAEDGII